jgi:hypothetical protein
LEEELKTIKERKIRIEEEIQKAEDDCSDAELQLDFHEYYDYYFNTFNGTTDETEDNDDRGLRTFDSIEEFRQHIQNTELENLTPEQKDLFYKWDLQYSIKSINFFMAMPVPVAYKKQYPELLQKVRSLYKLIEAKIPVDALKKR